MSASTKKALTVALPKLLAATGADARQVAGQAWPCTVVDVDGAIVTVTFDVSSEFMLPQVTCAIAESRYVRLPVQEGDKGMVMAASTRLGGVTGLGSGLAPLALPGNLGGLVYVPLGNKAWPTIDPNAVVVQAPNGAKILTDSGVSEIIVDTNQVKVTQGDVTVEITGGVVTVTADHVVVNAADSTFNGDVAISGNLTVLGNASVGGNATVTGAVSCATMSCTGLGTFGSLTVAGRDFTSHTHTPGGYHIGGSPVTGNSGSPV